MAYYPLNRTKTNSYTPGKEFIILSTKKPYTGYYWEDYEGKFFTGKTPNDPSPLELIPIPKQTPLDTPNIVLYVTSSITNSNYNNLKVPLMALPVLSIEGKQVGIDVLGGPSMGTYTGLITANLKFLLP